MSVRSFRLSVNYSSQEEFNKNLFLNKLRPLSDYQHGEIFTWERPDINTFYIDIYSDDIREPARVRRVMEEIINECIG